MIDLLSTRCNRHLRGAGGVVDSTSACLACRRPGFNTWSQQAWYIWCNTLALNIGGCIPCELENHGNVSVWDVKEPLRTASTLAVTTLSASIERAALNWCKCSGKDCMTSAVRPHKSVTL